MQSELPHYLHRQIRGRVEDVERRALQKGLERVLELELTTIRVEAERALAAGSSRRADAVLVMMEELKERIRTLPDEARPERARGGRTRPPSGAGAARS